MTGVERGDRGRAWFANLPSSWERARIKSIAKRVTDGAHISPETDTGVFDFVSTRDITSGVIDFDGALKTSPESYAYMVQTGCKPKKGDVLFSKDGSVGVTALVAKDHNFVVASSLIIVSPDARRMDSRFLNFAFSAQPLIEQAKAFTRGAGLPRISIANLARIEIPLPPLDEQRAIADYLDQETAQIDSLVAKQEEFIGLLRERRKRLIEVHALGGFNPLVPAEKIADVPIGAAFDVRLGKMLDAGKAIRDDDQDLPYLRAANIQDDGLNLENVKTMPYSRREAKILDLQAGDLLVVEGGAVGTNVLLDHDMPGWSFQKTVNRVRAFSTASTAWLAFVLRCYRDAGVFDIICNGSTIPHLTAEKLRSLRVPNFESSKQISIANLLDDQTSRIDDLIAKAEEHIALAKERRAALITAAVTGQFDLLTARKAG